MLFCLTPPCLVWLFDGDHGEKRWRNFADCLAYHAVFLRNHLRLLRAYVASRVPAANVEAIMLAVNEVNRCSYCQGLHGEMYRLSGASGGEDGGPTSPPVLEQEPTNEPLTVFF